jgi:hypothetical protein
MYYSRVRLILLYYYSTKIVSNRHTLDSFVTKRIAKENLEEPILKNESKKDTSIKRKQTTIEEP